MPEPRQIENLAEQATKKARRLQSKAALNNAIMLMAHDWSMAEIAEILRGHAGQIAEFG